ncbi:MAG: DUF4926 domain-containing protein [Thermoguttaceae bacterium]
MKYDIYDVVETKVRVNDIPSGKTGVIICVFDQPHEAYEVEFVDSKGHCKGQAVYLPDGIEKVEPRTVPPLTSLVLTGGISEVPMKYNY